jgi:NAD+ synthase (glutamine-hydrolysing)
MLSNKALKVLLGQINTTPGDFKGNYQQIIAGIDMAAEDQVDLAVFPELSIPGYLTADMMFESGYIEANLAYLHKIADYSRKAASTHIVVGYIGRNNTGQGKPFTNSLAVINNGVVVGMYNKRLLPFYDVFDEGRYYEPGRETLVLNINDSRVGFSICEDVWNDKGMENYLYEDNPAAVYRYELEVDFLVNISSSPYYRGKENERFKMLSEVASDDMAIIYVNQYGGQDELVFDGGSCIVYDSKLLYINENDIGYSEGPSIYKTVLFDSSTWHMLIGSSLYDIVTEEPNNWYLRDMLILGLRDYVHKTGFQKVVIGSSGGIDSAVVAALACEALGPENVYCVMMPTINSSSESETYAQELHSMLKCHELRVPIQYQDFLEHINHNMALPEGSSYNPVADENIQSRLRGIVLMHFANAYNALSLVTGNKTECAVGYFTLFGDSAGGFAPIKDLYKNEVYKIATFMNHRIPRSIIDRAPTAELKPDQTDEDHLLPYDILDFIVECNIERHITTYREFVAAAEGKASTPRRVDSWICTDYDKAEKEFNRILKLIHLNEFKRKLAPIGIKVSPKAFGAGRRMPIVSRRDWYM